MSGTKQVVDVREIEPKHRHPLIMDTFNSLDQGEVMEIINDHNPKPLHYQFMAELKDQFIWDYLENGPDVWRVALTKK